VMDMGMNLPVDMADGSDRTAAGAPGRWVATLRPTTSP